MGSILFFYISNLPNFGRTVRTICPRTRVREYIVRVLHGSFGCMGCGSLGGFSSSFGRICGTPGRATTLARLRGVGRG